MPVVNASQFPTVEHWPLTGQWILIRKKLEPP
jgi:hypothetical protein